MYHLMSEIKNQQKVLDRRVNKLLEKIDKQHHSKTDSDLLKEIKKQQIILDEKMLALMDLFELCHDKMSPPDEKDCCKKECCKKNCHHKKPDQYQDVETKIQDDQEQVKVEPKHIIDESSPLPKTSVSPEQPPLGELSEIGKGLHPLRLPPEPIEMDESSAHMPPSEHANRGLSQRPSGLPPVQSKLVEAEEALIVENQSLSTDNQRGMAQSVQVFSETAETSYSNAHGFAYSKEGTTESGVVKLTIAGPLQNTELVSNGLSVGNSGVYQVNYSVVLKTQDNVTEKAKFQMVINDRITIDSSTTESSLSQQISSTQLFSLMQGDVVKLVAEIPEGMSYSQATLQLIQIA